MSARSARGLALAAALLSPLWAGVALGLAETGLLWHATDPGSRLEVLLTCLGLALLLTAAALLPAQLVRLGLASLRRRPGGGAEGRRRSLAMALVLALAVGAVHAVVLRLLRARLVNVALAAVVALAVFALIAVIALGAFQLLVRLLSRLAARSTAASTLGPLAAAVAAWTVVGASAWPTLSSAWQVLPRSSLLLGAAWGILVLLGAHGDRLPASRAGAVALLVPLLALLVTSPVALQLVSRGGPLRTAVLARSHLVGVVPKAIWALFDADGDGFSPLLGGGDCDDGDGAIHPGAVEVLGNGQDEDCDGLVGAADPTAGTLTGRLVGPGCEERFSLPAKTNVLLLVVDALRADRLDGSYSRQVMPRLAQLSREAVYFPRCYSPHPSTAYAMPSLFTGLQSRWARDLMTSQYLSIPESRPLPQTLLGARGYRSGAVYGHFLAGHRHAMTRGFDATRLRPEPVNAELVADDALGFVDQLAAEGAPFFVYAHFYDPHWNYERYPEDRAPWGNGERVDRYDAELYNVDLALGRILDGLRARGLWERTLVMVVSDHGEEFGEHGGQFHGQTLYEEVIRVPCVIRAPGLAPRRVTQPVSLIDMLPTLLDLLDIDEWPAFQGVSVEPLMLGGACRRGPLVGEMQPWKERPPYKPWLWYLLDGDSKLVRDVETGGDMLFDLARDPGEKHNLVDSDGASHQRMRALLDETVRARINLPEGSAAREVLGF